MEAQLHLMSLAAAEAARGALTARAGALMATAATLASGGAADGAVSNSTTSETATAAAPSPYDDAFSFTPSAAAAALAAATLRRRRDPSTPGECASPGTPEPPVVPTSSTAPAPTTTTTTTSNQQPDSAPSPQFSAEAVAAAAAAEVSPAPAPMAWQPTFRESVSVNVLLAEKAGLEKELARVREECVAVPRAEYAGLSSVHSQMVGGQGTWVAAGHVILRRYARVQASHVPLTPTSTLVQLSGADVGRWPTRGVKIPLKGWRPVALPSPPVRYGFPRLYWWCYWW